MRADDVLLKLAEIQGSTREVWEILRQGQPLAPPRPYKDAKALACEKAEELRVAVYRQRTTELPQFVGSFR